jgi:hypothetical protein
VRLSLAMLIFGLAAQLFAQPSVDEEGRIGFRAIDIYLDSRGAPLAAYQIEFTDTNGVAKIVGLEGGESAAFLHPPFYDPRAMQQDRVIIAAFATNAVAELPVAKTRVATIHLQTRGTASPGFELKLESAADATGQKLQATASFEERKAK